MLKIRRSRDRLIFSMGLPIPGKHGLYMETGPRGPIYESQKPRTWNIFIYFVADFDVMPSLASQTIPEKQYFSIN